MADVLVWLISLGIGIFTLVVMVVVLQASLAAKEYYERKNREYHTRPIQR